MSERIQDVNILDQTNKDLISYSIYVARRRSLADPRDGLKPVHRKILYAMYNDFRGSSRVKTASVVGRVIEKYHPHGDASVSAAIKPMTNWFEINKPLIDNQGSFGNIWGQGASAPRYTEVGLSKYCIDCIIADMKESEGSTDWQETYDGKYQEPVYFPAAVPNLLINGSFGIAVGMRAQVPMHNINEVIDATIKLIDNPNADVVLVPDDCQGCDIVATDFAKISHTGKGKYRVRSRIEITEYEKHPALRVTCLPSLTFFIPIKEKIEKLVEENVLPQIVDVLNFSTVDKGKKSNDMETFSAMIVLKKGTDPNYVRDILFKTTDLQKTCYVNFEVVYNESICNLSYRDYLNIFLQFRRERKLRMFAGKHEKCRTKMHTMELYIRVLKSGKIDNIINMIRKQKSTDDSEYIDYMMKNIKGITPLQAKFILNTDIRKLSMGYLHKYEEEYEQATKEAKVYYDIITHPENIDSYIKEELIQIKKKYGEPRRSKVIQLDDPNSIPPGEFRIAITQKGFIKKVSMNEKLGTLKDDNIKFVLQVDNRDNLLLFSRLGKVYKIPVHMVPFTGKNSNGTDLRILVKKYTGDGICMITTDQIVKYFDTEMKNSGMVYNMYVLTACGLFKRMELDSIFDIPVSGLIYTRLNDGDAVADIIFMNPANEMLVYSNNKILRLRGDDAPLLSRSTKGNIAMSSRHPIDGMTCITNPNSYLVAITNSGKVNKVPLNCIPMGTRSRGGTSIIKLGKKDSIYSILECVSGQSLQVMTKKDKYTIPIDEIPNGSSISSGTKLFDSMGVLSAIVI